MADISKVASSGRSQDLFIIGDDGALWYAHDDGLRWSGWASLGGALTSAPVASRTKDRIDVYARGSDNQLWRKVWKVANGWLEWEPMGGLLTSGPAVADLAASVPGPQGDQGPRGDKGDQGSPGVSPTQFIITGTATAS
jgi:hypothetical protein